MERKQTIKVKNIGQKNLLVGRASKVKWHLSRLMTLLACTYKLLMSVLLTFYLSQSWDYHEALVWNADKELTSWKLSGFSINALVFPSEDSLRINLSCSVTVSKWGCFLLSKMHALMGSIEWHLNQRCLADTWYMGSCTDESLPSNREFQEGQLCLCEHNLNYMWSIQFQWRSEQVEQCSSGSCPWV